MRISDWSSDVCSSDLRSGLHRGTRTFWSIHAFRGSLTATATFAELRTRSGLTALGQLRRPANLSLPASGGVIQSSQRQSSLDRSFQRSEEHTSELQSLMRISYAVFCLKKKITTNTQQPNTTNKNAHHSTNNQ